MTSVMSIAELSDAAELGAIDDRSVRVWVRYPNTTELRGELEVEGEVAVSSSVRLSADTDWTGVLIFSLPTPAPGRKFICTVAGRKLSGRLAPSPETHAGVVFGFGSCNKPFIKAKNGPIETNPSVAIYPAMVGDLRAQDAAFVLAIGDQIYSEAFHGATGARSSVHDDPTEPFTLSDYRQIYRRFFNEPGFRALRDAFPTYCMWDDHDIINDWGSIPRSARLDRLFEVACRAYSEYQDSRNPTDADRHPPYHYHFRHGNIGFLALDVRGDRDMGSGRLLGEEQLQEAKAYLQGEAAQSVQTLFVVSTVPVAHASRWFVSLLERMPVKSAASGRDRWCSSAFVRDRDELLAALFAWRKAAPRRQVILLSGDIHAAGAFSIHERNGDGVIRQCISSPLTTPLEPVPALMTRVATLLPNLLESKFRIEQHYLLFAHNFGLVCVEPLAEGGHSVEFAVRAWQPEVRELRTAYRKLFHPS